MTEKLIIYKIETEENPDGISMLRITLKMGDALYVRGVQESDMLDPKKKKSIFRHWINSIGKIVEAQARPDKEKEDMKKTIKNMEGVEITDE